MIYLKTFTKGNLPGKARIGVAGNVGIKVVCENKEGLTEWPMLCPVTGRILYDHPERYPKYVKELTRKAFDWLADNPIPDTLLTEVVLTYTGDEDDPDWNQWTVRFCRYGLGGTTIYENVHSDRVWNLIRRLRKLGYLHYGTNNTSILYL